MKRQVVLGSQVQATCRFDCEARRRKPGGIDSPGIRRGRELWAARRQRCDTGLLL